MSLQRRLLRWWRLHVAGNGCDYWDGCPVQEATVFDPGKGWLCFDHAARFGIAPRDDR